MSKRKSRTAEQWARIVAEWVASGASAKAYAEQHHLNARSLVFWKWQLAKRSAAPAAPEVPPCDFVEVRAAVTPGDSTYEIVFRTGHRLRVPRRFESDDLKRLIGILGEPQ